MEFDGSLMSNEGIIDTAQFDALKNHITDRTTNLKQLKNQTESCRNTDTQAWLSNPTCDEIKTTYALNTKEQQQQFANITDKNIQLSDTCYSLIFRGDAINPRIQGMININTQTTNMEMRIRENIKTLDQYKRFPLQLYQWTHVVDRYLAEITAIVDNFFGYITLWLNTNASRFEQYVDAIITISTALQTRQVLLNLSTDRQKRCSSCTVDNYDAYACSL